MITGFIACWLVAGVQWCSMVPAKTCAAAIAMAPKRPAYCVPKRMV